MTLNDIRTPARSGGRRRVPWHHIQITEACWLWTGPVWKGYGKASGTTAHRHVWLALGRTIAAGLELDHLCRRPLCVNPVHLEPVTRAENARRRAFALVTCTNGHDYTPENTYIRPDGSRDCRICIRARVAKYRRTHALRSAASKADGHELDAGLPVTGETNFLASEIGHVLQVPGVVGDAQVHEQVTVLGIGEAVGVSVDGHVPGRFGHARTLSGATQ